MKLVGILIIVLLIVAVILSVYSYSKMRESIANGLVSFLYTSLETIIYIFIFSCIALFVISLAIVIEDKLST